MIVARLFNGRVWIVRGRRIHHGATGCALVALGALLIADDWKDRWWSWRP